MNNKVLLKFEKVLERDIDLLLINKLCNDKNLINLFLNKINKRGYEIYSIQHSAYNEYGESDIVVILQKNNNKIALLIENKIDANAMPEQFNRYILRGNQGVKTNEFNEFFVFIIAPNDYLRTNTEASKYKNQISYEELLKNLQNDLFAINLISKAIEEKKFGYVIIENIEVTNFWKEYYKFIKENFPQLNLKEINGPRGSKACWPEFRTPIKNIKVVHKSNKGFVDLTFRNLSSKYTLFCETVNKHLDKEMYIDRAGKSLVIRIKTPLINFTKQFKDYENEMNKTLQAVIKLLNLLSKIEINYLY